MSLISGKALLVITSNGASYGADVYAFVQSATGGKYAHECAHEDLPMLVESYGLSPLKAFERMPEGETIRVAVAFDLVYSKDYWGECDVDLVIRKVRVLRRQKARSGRYIAKKNPD